MKPFRFDRTGALRRRGLSLTEVVVSTFLVGVLLVAAMRTVSGSVRASLANARSGCGLALAQELMSEIVTAQYVEPDEAPTFGPEASETGGNRGLFDDVDDYHNWDASPPQNVDGTVIPDRVGWRRTVAVEYLDPNDLTTTVGSDQGVKRITVTVIREGSAEVRLIAIRTDTQ